MKPQERKRMRLENYDYHRVGYYFVTVCTNNRACLFGKIQDQEMLLNDAGNMIYAAWKSLPNKYPNVELDEFIVMPNHVHAIVIIDILEAHPISLPDIMRNIKSYANNRYMHGVREKRYSPFEKRLWQKGYYEHVIRHDENLKKIRQYIQENPLNRLEDQENPKNFTKPL